MNNQSVSSNSSVSSIFLDKISKASQEITKTNERLNKL